ncbi:MAG: hypothetical protein R3B84_11185 [Zavarzinella sp.]
MKKDERLRLGFSGFARLLIRFLGLLGLLAAAVGLFVARPNLPVGNIDLSWPYISSLMHDSKQVVRVAIWCIVAGTAAFALAVTIELLSALFGSARRSAVGFNATLQSALIVGVVVVINIFSFQYFLRFDCTRDKKFTLPQDVVQQLKALKQKTTVVIVQKKAQGPRLGGEPDRYDVAAELKQIEKIKDLIAQFRQLGGQFSVVSLNIESDDYEKEYEALTANRPGIGETIQELPQSSILFYADDLVKKLPLAEATARKEQGLKLYHSRVEGTDDALVYENTIPWMSFDEFYRLDKKLSQEANKDAEGTPRGNLVMWPQPIQAFTNRVFSVQEKKPRIAFLASHEWLSTTSSTGAQQQYTSAGLRKTLEANGFEVVDIILKKFTRGQPPSPAAYNRTETEFFRQENTLNATKASLAEERESLEELTRLQKDFQSLSLDELKTKYFNEQAGELTEELRTAQLNRFVTVMKSTQERIDNLNQQLADTEARLKILASDERAFEDNRVNDVYLKLSRQLATCDMVIIPRWTLINLSEEESIPASLYSLSTEQVRAIQDFMKSGKPVMALLGANLEPNSPAPTGYLDDFEKLLADRGVYLSQQAVLFDREIESFSARQGEDLLGGAAAEIPPVTFPEKSDNPMAMILQRVADSVAGKMSLVVRHPMPVYVHQAVEKQQGFPASFIDTSANSWNESSPFPEVRRISPTQAVLRLPRYEATGFGDPAYDTLAAERRGPFPVGVVVDAPIPVSWYDISLTEQIGATTFAAPGDFGLSSALLTAAACVSKGDADNSTLMNRANSRMIVIGQGGVFTGKDLEPAQAELLLASTNWLLNRSDRLPTSEGKAWSYPRVQFHGKAAYYWSYGPLAFLPIFFGIFGVCVLLLRNIR